MKVLLSLFSLFIYVPLFASVPVNIEPENFTQNYAFTMTQSGEFQTDRFRARHLHYNETDDALRAIVDESRYEGLINRQLEFIADLPNQTFADIIEINSNNALRFSEKWEAIKNILLNHDVDVIEEYLGLMDDMLEGEERDEYHRLLTYGLGEFLIFDKETNDVAGWLNLSQDLKFGGYSELYIQVRPQFRGGAGTEIYKAVKQYIDRLVGHTVETPEGGNEVLLGAFAAIRADNVASKKAAGKAGWTHFKDPDEDITSSDGSEEDITSSDSLSSEENDESESSSSSSEDELYDPGSYYYFTSTGNKEFLNIMFGLDIES